MCSLLLLLLLLLSSSLGFQASLSEIHSNMWVRNGLQIKGQAMTYVQSHFCNSMIDPDIYLLQVCRECLTFTGQEDRTLEFPTLLEKPPSWESALFRL